MARPLSELRTPDVDPSELGRDLGVNHRTSRSFAAAVAVLLLATIVVGRSSSALVGDSASAAAVVNSGTIELSDNDQGRSLFDLDALTPARPAVRCIQVTYGGTILPVSLQVKAEAQGSLGRYLDVTIDEGTGGRFGECVDFVANSTVYDGPLSDLTGFDWLKIGNIVNSGEIRSFRVSINLEDVQDALGKETSLAFAWEVVPS